MSSTSPRSGTLRLLAFAGTRDVLGVAETELAFDAPCTAADLWPVLCAKWPGLAAYQRSIRLAVNGTYAEPGDPVRAGDEVALIPPVAGG